MKKQNNSYRAIVILLFITIMINGVLAIDKIKPQPLPSANFGLDNNKVQQLADKGISNVEIIEYPCQDGMRCFAVAGDINQSLISINTTVRDNCIQNKIQVQKVVIIGNKSKLVNSTRSYCSGQYNYRIISQEEIDSITNNALNKLLEQQLPTEPDPYYPIPDGTQTQSKSISIGNSVGSWVGKVIQQIGGLFGL